MDNRDEVAFDGWTNEKVLRFYRKENGRYVRKGLLTLLPFGVVITYLVLLGTGYTDHHPAIHAAPFIALLLLHHMEEWSLESCISVRRAFDELRKRDVRPHSHRKIRLYVPFAIGPGIHRTQVLIGQSEEDRIVEMTDEELKRAEEQSKVSVNDSRTWIRQFFWASFFSFVACAFTEGDLAKAFMHMFAILSLLTLLFFWRGLGEIAWYIALCNEQKERINRK